MLFASIGAAKACGTPLDVSLPVEMARPGIAVEPAAPGSLRVLAVHLQDAFQRAPLRQGKDEHKVLGKQAQLAVSDPRPTLAELEL